METFGKLFIYNYRSKQDGTYYFVAKHNGKYYFVRMHNDLTKLLEIGINSNNQSYFIYNGFYTVDEESNVIQIVDWS